MRNLCSRQSFVACGQTCLCLPCARSPGIGQVAHTHGLHVSHLVNDGRSGALLVPVEKRCCAILGLHEHGADAAASAAA